MTPIRPATTRQAEHLRGVQPRAYRKEMGSCRHGRVARGGGLPWQTGMRNVLGIGGVHRAATLRKARTGKIACLTLGGEFHSVTCWQLPPPVMDTLHAAHHNGIPDETDMHPAATVFFEQKAAKTTKGGLP